MGLQSANAEKKRAMYTQWNLEWAKSPAFPGRTDRSDGAGRAPTLTRRRLAHAKTSVFLFIACGALASAAACNHYTCEEARTCVAPRVDSGEDANVSTVGSSYQPMDAAFGLGLDASVSEDSQISMAGEEASLAETSITEASLADAWQSTIGTAGSDAAFGCQDGQVRPCADDGLKGPCMVGYERCTSGLWGPCSVAPAPTDSCHVAGDDSSCDGMPNAGCICVVGQTRSCAADGSKGNCATGTETCGANATWGPCSITAAASDSCYEGDDANCDGTPNQGCVCIAGRTRTCREGGLYGKCADGTQTCDTSGNWGACSIAPSASDTCEAGNDDNCNGKVNEQCPCIQGSTRSCSLDGLFSKCAAGMETCNSSAQWGACSVPPAASDTCAPGNDDNCNGIANDGCLCLVGSTRICGPCGDGHETCTDGRADTWSACTGGTPQKTYYRDADGDGHGDPNITSTVCGSAPSGYVATNDDCCDANGQVYPGNPNWYTEAHAESPACGSVHAFDYDCNGREDLQYPSQFQGCDSTDPCKTICADGICTNQKAWASIALPNGTPGPAGVPGCGQKGGFEWCNDMSSGQCARGGSPVAVPQYCH